MIVPAFGNEVIWLEALELSHAAALAEAASFDRTSFGYTRVPDGLDEARAYIREARTEHEAGRAVPFAVVLATTGRLVGSTRFLDLTRFDGASARPQACEVGATWYAADVQRTAVNTATKLLLLGYAFETWQVKRVSLKTDSRNLRSRASIERLGAQYEGTRRCHSPAPDGTIRDTAYYSILASEWPRVSVALSAAVRRPPPRRTES